MVGLGEDNRAPPRGGLGIWLSRLGKAVASGRCIGLGPGQGRGARRLVSPACKVLLALSCLLLALAGMFAARLALGPLRIDGFGPHIAKALGERFGAGYEFGVGGIAIVGSGWAPALSVDGLSIKEPSGRTVLIAPRAEVSVAPFALVAGRLMPSRLELFDVEVHLALRPDGSLAVPAAANSGEALALTPPLAQPFAPKSALPSNWAYNERTQAAPLPRSLLVKRLAASIRLVVDTLTNPQSPAAAIDRIGIARGKMVVVDETADQTIVFNGVDLAFEKAAGAKSFSLSVEGPNGRWQASGSAAGTPDTERGLVLSVSNISLDEILLAAGRRSIGADFDMPLSGRISIRLNAAGALSKADGAFESGSGYLRLDDPDDEPMMVDKIAGGFHWDAAARQIAIERWRLVAGSTHFAMSGSVALPEHEGDPWPIRLANAEPNEAGPQRPGEKPISIDRTEVAAQLYLAEKKLRIDRLSFGGPQCGFALAGTIDWTDGPHLRLGASISPAPVATVLRLWPSFVAAKVRSYLLSRAQEGTVAKGTMQIDFDAADLQAMRTGRAPPDSKAVVDFAIMNASLVFLPGVPPLRGIDGVGHITGRTAAFSVSNAAVETSNGRVLSLTDASFRVPDTDATPVPAVAETKLAGSVEAIGELLSHDALKPYASLPLDPATLHGQAEGTLAIAMKLGSQTSPADTALKIDSTVANFVAERLIGNGKLEAATLAVTVDALGLRASGQGSMFGAPATIEIEKSTGKSAEAAIGLTFDDETRARLGFGAVPGVSGPIGAKISAPVGTGEKPKARIELDLNGAAIELPGISKPAGRPGKIAFALAVNDSGTSLDQIAVDAGAVQARGKADLGAGFSLIAASFPKAKFSPGDDMRIDAAGSGETINVIVRGNAIDARPFLKSLIFSPHGSNGAGPGNGAERTGPVPAKQIEFDVKSGILTGYNKQTISGAELRFAKNGSQIKQFAFSGTFGKQPVSCNLTGGGGAPQFNLLSEDGGSLLSFLDLYKHMERGRLAVGMIVGTDTLTGVLVINDFVLRDEPALRRLVTEGSPPPGAPGRGQKIDAGAIAFNKLQVRFQRDGSRLVLSDGTMHGEAIGLTVDGALDYVHDNVDMKGTFVPIYALNNMFAKIPVVGMILGGGSEEGLIGVNYRISGLASAPTLSINPLSAITPGIFRQIFGVVDFDPAHPQR